MTSSEGCDDGNLNNLDGCGTSCVIETGWNCDNSVSPSLCKPICGDAKVMIGEICDDGDVSGSTGCLADCSATVTGWICTGGTTTSPMTCIEVCGNSILTLTEHCDDGNSISNDGCSNLC